LQDIYTEVKLPEDFLHELAKRFYDDGLVEVIGSTITGISEEIASLKFNENYRSVLRVYYLFDVSKYRQSLSSCNANQ
jgi:hypothetical protein